MKQNIEGAAFRPNKKMLEFVQKCAIEIEPNDSKLANWSRSYAENHSNGIAMDVQLFERYATKTDLVLEYGSIPLLFTAAIAKLGYKISGIDPCLSG